MGIVTWSVKERRSEDLQEGVDAYREERVRLAMWRLDTLATAIVGTEDKRRVEEFERSEVDSSSIEELVTVNPLFSEVPDHANFYWTIGDGRKLETPQVYESVKEGVAGEVNERNRQRFVEVKKIMSSKLDVALHGEVPLCDTNGDLSCVVADLTLTSLQVKEEPVADDVKFENENEYSKVSQKLKDVNKPVAQKRMNIVERKKRVAAIDQLSNNYQWGNDNSNVKQEASADEVLEVTAFKPVWLDNELMLVRRVKRSSDEKVQGVWLNKKAVRRQLLDEIEDLFPYARLVPVMQNFDSLLAGEVSKSGDDTMLKLPFRLLPGERQLVSVEVKDVMTGTVGLAWIGVVLAVVAGFFLLRGVMEMSERRASFVSSVTHELRTPLTTFRLYTDMLTSGLMKEEEKKDEYLGVLRLESERLTHLVENVLAYSGIERGSARTKMELVRVGDLMEGMRMRLESRASEEEMEIILEMKDEVADERVRMDVTAVEQIVFNLVDNAAKYASGKGCGSRIFLDVGMNGSGFMIAVEDEGRGIARRERGRLFKAFHKSSEEAAATKPGVGLGLSLCRRLAKAMGGNLKLVGSKNASGARFELLLPQKNE